MDLIELNYTKRPMADELVVRPRRRIFTYDSPPPGAVQPTSQNVERVILEIRDVYSAKAGEVVERAVYAGGKPMSFWQSVPTFVANPDRRRETCDEQAEK